MYPIVWGLLACSGRLEGGLHEITLESGGISRKVLLHVPKTHQKGEDLPLVLVFHGGQGERETDGQTMVKKWDHLRDGDFAMAFPEGIGTGERAWAGPDDERDLRFVDDLLSVIDQKVGIDLTRVYAAGFSNGSGFVWMLECSRADRFAGFGHVQQSMAEEVYQRCKPSKHVPTIWIHGDADPKAVWEGNNQTIGVPRTIDYLLSLHGCDPAQAREVALPDLPGDETHVTRTTWGPCMSVSGMELLRVVGGQHHWPVADPGRKGPKKGQSTDIDGAAEIVRFWRENAML